MASIEIFVTRVNRDIFNVRHVLSDSDNLLNHLRRENEELIRCNGIVFGKRAEGKDPVARAISIGLVLRGVPCIVASTSGYWGGSMDIMKNSAGNRGPRLANNLRDVLVKTFPA